MAFNIDLKIEENIKKVISEVFNPVFMGKIAKETADQVRLRTRLGKGSENGNVTNLRQLAEKTKKIRTRYKKNLLSGKTAPNFSNLTATGTMLNAIDGKWDSDKIVLFFKNIKAKKLKDLSNSNLTVSELADIHQNHGAGKTRIKRPFFSLTNFEKEEIARKVRDGLRQKIKQHLT